jgi:ATP sulfurylase
VLESRVLRIFELKRDEVTGEWRMLHNEKLHNWYFPSSIIRTVKLWRMRLAGHGAQMWKSCAKASGMETTKNT